MGVCKYTPSPGDTGEKGCGLLPANEFAVWLYPRWKSFGEAAFQMVDLTMTAPQAENLMEKLMVIQQHIPHIIEAKERRVKAVVPKRKRR